MSKYFSRHFLLNLPKGGNTIGNELNGICENVPIPNVLILGDDAWVVVAEVELDDAAEADGDGGIGAWACGCGGAAAWTLGWGGGAVRGGVGRRTVVRQIGPLISIFYISRKLFLINIQVCCRWNQERKQFLWKICWQERRLILCCTCISSRHIIHVVSAILASSSAVKSGYIVFKFWIARRDSITSLHDLRNALQIK
jgi:hypothetical protein